MKQMEQSKNQKNQQDEETKKRLKQQAMEEAMKGRCDPVYEDLIKDIIDGHGKEESQSAFVVVNSFDYENEDIREMMSERKIIAEVFEIDRLQSQQRMEYLNCFKKIYAAEELPMVFMKERYIGGVKDLQNFFAQVDT